MVQYLGTKRSAGPISAGQVAKRLRKVEALARSNRPEMQTKTITVSGSLATNSLVNGLLTNIAQGNGVDERRGDEIKVWRVEIRGLSDVHLDHYLVQLHTTSEPTVAVMNSTPGAFFLDSESNSRFTEWKHYRNFSASGTDDGMRIVQKFNGMRVKYNGSTATSAISNQLCYTVLNRTASTRNVTVTARVWFTDP